MTRRSYIAAPSPRANSGRKPKIAERDVLRACLDLLAVKHIWHRRMNTGAVKAEGRFFRFGSLGMADILTLPKVPLVFEGGGGRSVSRPFMFAPLWVEVKASDGKQSEAQKQFQAEVEAEGHSYMVVSDVDTLMAWLKERGI